MKVAVHFAVDSAEVAWAKQFAGEDAAVKKQFPDAPFGIRARKAVLAVTWESLVSTIEQAARMAAGCDGWIGLVSGHGGSGCSSQDVLTPSCPIDERRVASIYFDPHKTLSFNQRIAFYNVSPGGPSRSDHENDDAVVSGKIAGNKAEAQKRLNLRKYYDRIGAALRTNHVRRMAFLVCNIGASTAFMDQLAKDWGAEMAAFKFRTACGFDSGNKARLWLNRDKVDGQGTNIMEARVYSPNPDDVSIGYVARPPRVNIWEQAKSGAAVCPSGGPHLNVWQRAKVGA